MGNRARKRLRITWRKAMEQDIAARMKAGQTLFEATAAAVDAEILAHRQKATLAREMAASIDSFEAQGR